MIIDNRIKVFSSKNTIQKRRLTKMLRSYAVMMGLDSPKRLNYSLKAFRSGRELCFDLLWRGQSAYTFAVEIPRKSEGWDGSLNDMLLHSRRVAKTMFYIESNFITPDLTTTETIEIFGKHYGSVYNLLRDKDSKAEYAPAIISTAVSIEAYLKSGVK